ncbi:MAG: aminoglycoside phosphotransferase family protein [Candidatus Daviesbacteria bacterium]
MVEEVVEKNSSLDEEALVDQAQESIESVGYRVESIVLIPEGRGHYNFSVVTPEKLMIARFERPQTNVSSDGVRRDVHFNGPLSLERERNLMDLVREEAGLPAPKVYGLHQSRLGPFLLVEKLQGIYWSEYLKENDYSLEAYLRSVGFLGADIGCVHQIQFNTFGDAMGKGIVYPSNITNFVTRLQMTTELNLERVKHTEALQIKELYNITKFFQEELKTLDECWDKRAQEPVLILTDLHPMNILVDDQGKPSGYFDLEFAQAGHPSLEFYVLRLSFLHYFEGVSQQAEDMFLAGYEKNGGRYNPKDPFNQKLEHLMIVNHLLASVTAYHNVFDGLRDTWSEQFKNIMFEGIEVGNVDYSAINEVLRSKTKQPKFPLKF